MKATSGQSQLDAALDAWRDALGERAVALDRSVVEHWGRTTAWRSPQPLAVLRARGTAEVAAAAKIAHRFRIPIYPVSRGKNWGQGDACPSGEGQVVLDLSEMNRIVEVHSELAYAVVEPGVTQGELAERLAGDESLMLDVTASSSNSSILGNYLERGDGFSPYGDRFSHCCGMEVVLADGTVIETGYGRFAEEGHSGCRYLARWGVGPSLDGLFSQSNLGIVTRLGIWLVRKPQHVLGFFGSVTASRLPALMCRLRELHLGGVLQNPIHLYNATRIADGQAPIDGASGSGSAAADASLPLFGDWNLWGGFFGDQALCQARLRAARRELRGICRLHAVTATRLSWLERLSQAMRWLGMQERGARWQALVACGRDGMEKLLGQPSDNAIRAVCARAAGMQVWDGAGPPDLRDYNVGLYWITHLCPVTSEDLGRCLEVVEGTLQRFGFKPHLTLTVLQARAALCNVTIYYDRTDSRTAQRADACRAELTSRLIAAGFPPYRLGIHSMEQVSRIGLHHASVLEQVKAALDPHRVLAPGRYLPCAQAAAHDRL